MQSIYFPNFVHFIHSFRKLTHCDSENVLIFASGKNMCHESGTKSNGICHLLH